MNHKTALATAASVAGVLLAGVVAVGANIGILASTDVGELDSQDPTVVAASSETRQPEVVTVVVDDLLGATSESSAVSTPSTTLPPAPQTELLAFEVPGVGIITLARQDGILAVDEIQAAGWDWTIQEEGREVKIVFVSGDRQIEFEAKVQNGEVVPKVEERQTRRGYDDDDDDSYEHDDDDGRRGSYDDDDDHDRYEDEDD